MNNLIVAYRDNDLFHEHIPAILELIPRETLVRRQFVYPAQTQEQDIYKELVPALIAEPAPFLYLSDWTCSIYNLQFSDSEKQLNTRIHKEEIKELIRLDSAFGAAISRIIGNDFAEALKKLAKLSLASPTAIFIVARRISDHVSLDGEMGEKYSLGNEKKYIALIQSVLKGAYPDIPIEVKATAEKAQDDSEKLGEVLVIVDRHDYKGTYGWQWSPQTTQLLLPLSSGTDHLVRSGKIKACLDPADVYREIFKEER